MTGEGAQTGSYPLWKGLLIGAIPTLLVPFGFWLSNLLLPNAVVIDYNIQRIESGPMAAIELQFRNASSIAIDEFIYDLPEDGLLYADFSHGTINEESGYWEGSMGARSFLRITAFYTGLKPSQKDLIDGAIRASYRDRESTSGTLIDKTVLISDDRKVVLSNFILRGIITILPFSVILFIFIIIPLVGKMMAKSQITPD